MKLSVQLLLGLAVLAIAFSHGRAQEADDPVMEPVEFDVHEFMEYAFEPTFAQLKQALAQEPAERKAWVPVKAASLLLAENGNLLMLRPPEEEADDWNRLSAELRDSGRELYQAAKTRDYPTTRKKYVNFVQKCNACHNQYADGEHLQEP
mgnify:CR=1 FL=1